MAPWFNQFKVSSGCWTQWGTSFFLLLLLRTMKDMFFMTCRKRDIHLLLFPQLTASPPARTVAPAVGRIPACVAPASRGPAVRRWPPSRCTSGKGAVWGAFSQGPTLSRGTNRREGPPTRLSIPPRSRPHDLQPPGSQLTPCKCCSCASPPLLNIAPMDPWPRQIGMAKQWPFPHQ